MTDLLDGWEDGSVELPPPAGMSPERIKERTMEKIRQTKRPRRRMGVRLLACAALAAVFTVSAMAAYHLWGPGELFDPFFTLESAPLDDGQKELLDQIGTTNLPPVTSNGVTLTPLAFTISAIPSANAPWFFASMWSWSMLTPGSGSTGACRRPGSSRTTPLGTTPWSWCSCFWAGQTGPTGSTVHPKL